MTQDRSDQRAESNDKPGASLRAEADRLRRLSDPTLTAPIYGKAPDDGLAHRKTTLFGRLRDALLP